MRWSHLRKFFSAWKEKRADALETTKSISDDVVLFVKQTFDLDLICELITTRCARALSRLQGLSLLCDLFGHCKSEVMASYVLATCPAAFRQSKVLPSRSGHHYLDYIQVAPVSE